jgi:hypothetical protein
MRGRIRAHLTYANVMATIAVFLVLGGGAYAATGGRLILGQANSADATTGLSSNVASGPTLHLTNTGGQPAASFTGGTGAAPFAVNSTKKVAKLNADRLDGIDSSGFVPSSSLERFGPVTLQLDPDQVQTVPLLTVGNFSFAGECKTAPGAEDVDHVKMFIGAVAHSTYASLTQDAAGGTFGNGDMSAGTAYPLAQIDVANGTPNFNPITGSAVDPSGKEVIFNLYQGVNARNQPGQCIWGGSFVVK